MRLENGIFLIKSPRCKVTKTRVMVSPRFLSPAIQFSSDTFVPEDVDPVLTISRHDRQDERVRIPRLDPADGKENWAIQNGSVVVKVNLFYMFFDEIVATRKQLLKGTRATLAIEGVSTAVVEVGDTNLNNLRRRRRASGCGGGSSGDSDHSGLSLSAGSPFAGSSPASSVPGSPRSPSYAGSDLFVRPRGASSPLLQGAPTPATPRALSPGSRLIVGEAAYGKPAMTVVDMDRFLAHLARDNSASEPTREIDGFVVWADTCATWQILRDLHLPGDDNGHIFGIPTLCEFLSSTDVSRDARDLISSLLVFREFVTSLSDRQGLGLVNFSWRWSQGLDSTATFNVGYGLNFEQKVTYRIQHRNGGYLMTITPPSKAHKDSRSETRPMPLEEALTRCLSHLNAMLATAETR